MHIMLQEEVSSEILNCKSKLLQIKLPFFYVFQGRYKFNFLKRYININETPSLIFDIFKLSLTIELEQIYFK